MSIHALYPPHEVGCHQLVNGVWQSIACMTAADYKAHPMPDPIPVADSIESQPKRRLIISPLTGMSPTITSPLVWGSAAVQFETDPTKATEVNVPKPTQADPTPASSPNEFSIQVNTNDFTCTTCKAGYPFGGTPGVANSTSAAGDRGWVQFTYQQGAPVYSNRMCVWNWDVTLYWNTQGKAASDQHTCVTVPENTTPLTGPGAPNQSAEVIGYITCASAGNCLLETLGYVPWTGSWYSVSEQDTLGLSGNWLNVSGTIFGLGGDSEASFKNTTVQQTVTAYSCFAEPTSSNGYLPQACTLPGKPMFAWYLDLSATPEQVVSTGETSNLTSAPGTFQCNNYDCQLWYDSSAP